MFIYLLIYLLIYLFIYLLIYLFTYLFIYLFMYLFIIIKKDRFEELTKEGCGRVSVYNTTSILHAYTLECGFH